MRTGVSTDTLRKTIQFVFVFVIMLMSVMPTSAWANLQSLMYYGQPSIGIVTQYGYEDVATVFQIWADPFSDIGNWAYTYQAGEDNFVLAWQNGFDNLAMTAQIGAGNLAVAVQEGSNHLAAIGQFGDDNQAIAWQDGNESGIVIMQFGDQRTVHVLQGSGVVFRITQLGW